jgi:hypothetical protein
MDSVTGEVLSLRGYWRIWDDPFFTEGPMIRTMFYSVEIGPVDGLAWVMPGRNTPLTKVSLPWRLALDISGFLFSTSPPQVDNRWPMRMGRTGSHTTVRFITTLRSGKN